MKPLLIPKGTLKNLAVYKNFLTNLTFAAEREREYFADLQIITLTQHAKELALDKALSCNIDSDSIKKTIDMLLYTEYTHGREFICVNEDQIQIGVNRLKIDDDAVCYAMSLLTQIETFTPGYFEEFGKRIRIHEFKTQQITSNVSSTTCTARKWI
jgi:hypothetical protein